MNKIQELIKQLCPNGVEWKTLGEVCQVLRGRRLTKSQLSETGKYKVYHGGIDPIGFYNEKNRDANTVMIINVGASAGTVGFSFEDFWSSDGCFCISHSISLNSRFLFYYFQSIENCISSKVRHAGIPTLDSKVIENISIPVPPLPIQTEIVNILDKFVEQQEQLEKLIELRKKQYEWYREEMLTAKEGWETVAIGDLALKLASGATPNGGEDAYKESGISLIRSQNVLDFNMSFLGLAHIDQNQADKLKNVEVKENDLLLNITGDSVARICKVDPSILPARVNQHVMIIRLNKDINSNFVLYSLINAKKYLLQVAEANGGSRKALTKKNVSDFVIHLPSSTTQKEIADALDSFESSISALTSALELSKKRYEYYRDEMMRF